ncbi:uncharacterized protein MYCGRDRAFT_97287 [Zymoseptoria tritici IPO323]|uniref:Uncharacterized protein n=1 Tax=Zymoseptoria tritici (strain CBS 115943 / IPO323) TaxID=336722 RepID=F9XPQ8_ZYMTI|nr:uncharacterized protein MYCGRDRAFT_97287 [Zymoseptoria tritici IPO323]EGP82502.1 hypothetical protein MYCGRDRAFT_97287 [Zymoseptoria tritici IPO323]
MLGTSLLSGSRNDHGSPCAKVVSTFPLRRRVIASPSLSRIWHLNAGSTSAPMVKTAEFESGLGGEVEFIVQLHADGGVCSSGRRSGSGDFDKGRVAGDGADILLAVNEGPWSGGAAIGEGGVLHAIADQEDRKPRGGTDELTAEGFVDHIGSETEVDGVKGAGRASAGLGVGEGGLVEGRAGAEFDALVGEADADGGVGCCLAAVDGWGGEGAGDAQGGEKEGGVLHVDGEDFADYCWVNIELED